MYGWVTAKLGEIRRQFKPRDVEEPIDFYFHRPLAGLLVQALVPLPITPNQVTIVSGITGLLAGLCVAGAVRGGPGWLVAGGLVLLLATLLDCADGQLARIRGETTLFGRALDGVMDAVAPLAVYHGMALYLLDQGYSFTFLWTVGWATGISQLVHCNQYDHAKNVYLLCTDPSFAAGGSVLPRIEDLEREREDYRARGMRLHAFVMGVLLRWTQGQLARQRAAGEVARAELRPRDAQERALYRRIFAGHMRAWSWLGLGTHMFILMLACLFGARDPRLIVAAWAIILFGQNALFAWLLWRRPRLQARYAEALRALRAGAV